MFVMISPDGDPTSRILAEEEWESKLLHPECTAQLFPCLPHSPICTWVLFFLLSYSLYLLWTSKPLFSFLLPYNFWPNIMYFTLFLCILLGLVTSNYLSEQYSQNKNLTRPAHLITSGLTFDDWSTCGLGFLRAKPTSRKNLVRERTHTPSVCFGRPCDG